MLLNSFCTLLSLGFHPFFNPYDTNVSPKVRVKIFAMMPGINIKYMIKNPLAKDFHQRIPKIILFSYQQRYSITMDDVFLSAYCYIAAWHLFNFLLSCLIYSVNSSLPYFILNFCLKRTLDMFPHAHIKG